MATGENKPAASVLAFPRAVIRPARACDLLVRLDRRTLEYTYYKEHTPGTLLLAPSEILNKRMGDIAPEIAEIYEPAIEAAVSSGSMQQVKYQFKGRRRMAHIIVTGQQAIIGIKAK